MLVEIWSDVVCPWCSIGRARLDAALARFPHAAEVEVRWRSFELDPSAHGQPERDLTAELARKYGTDVSGAQQMLDRVAGVAADEGLTFRFDLARRVGTFDAHRLLHLAAERGVQDALKRRLFRAYFEEGRSVADHDELVALGAEVGLDAEEARAVLRSDAFADAVRDDERAASQMGASGVPFFVVDRRIAVSGAQDPDVLLQLLERGWEGRAPAVVPAGADGEACGLDGEGCA